ncbi:hypothetical protein DTO166G4_1068 [Paecilomyces variotii]|nr:hypothetical protein DTO032I3_8728 [Paecilomyces variotii]KAJ9217437.1 hypothetical protein DTO166G4_1068 [Paecilomyces variotii]KAJ9241931.1 hypothetical protein DTO166G5_1007 [Paecilomyces variotii]KAJ9266109.1 hypothetical protein DTO195F2_1224 [Paecilomyces variotii]KAJ9277884.1 hypothetical protein DTO021D3_5208 [Paecilomyces variotii]
MSSIPTVHSTSKSIPIRQKAWHEYLTLDLFLAVLNRTFLHPFIAWIVVLCLRAQVTPYEHPAMIIAISYAILLTVYTGAQMVSERIAFGLPRTVDLGEEVVVITGGASGLGQLIAQIYGMRGVSVAVLDVKEVAEIEGWEELSGVEYYKCDVGDRKEVEKTARMIEKDLGTPTVLINCAAAGINAQPFLSLSTSAIKKTIQTNLLAPFHTCQTFLPGMLEAENGGTIVNVSSVLGQLSAAGLSDYSASKAGLSALHRTLEAELRASGDHERVKMLLVEIGQMSTPLFDRIKTPNRFFAPVLEPVQVAQAIISAVDNGKGGVIRLPAFATLVNLYAALPVGVQRIARYLSGIDTAVAKSAAENVEQQQPLSQDQTSESELEIINAEQ